MDILLPAAVIIVAYLCWRRKHTDCGCTEHEDMSGKTDLTLDQPTHWGPPIQGSINQPSTGAISVPASPTGFGFKNPNQMPQVGLLNFGSKQMGWGTPK